MTYVTYVFAPFASDTTSRKPRRDKKRDGKLVVHHCNHNYGMDLAAYGDFRLLHLPLAFLMSKRRLSRRSISATTSAAAALLASSSLRWRAQFALIRPVESRGSILFDRFPTSGQNGSIWQHLRARCTQNCVTLNQWLRTTSRYRDIKYCHLLSHPITWSYTVPGWYPWALGVV